MLKKLAVCFLVVAGISTTGFTQAYIDKIVRRSVSEYRLQIQQQQAEKSFFDGVVFTNEAEASVITTDRFVATEAQKFPSYLAHGSAPKGFSERYHAELLALLGLLTIWPFVRLHKPRSRGGPVVLDAEDYAMIRIIKDNALNHWEKCNPRRSVIDLSSWGQRN